MRLFNKILHKLVVELNLHVCRSCIGYGQPGTWVSLRTPGCKQMWEAIIALQWVPNATGVWRDTRYTPVLLVEDPSGLPPRI